MLLKLKKVLCRKATEAKMNEFFFELFLEPYCPKGPDIFPNLEHCVATCMQIKTINADRK